MMDEKDACIQHLQDLTAWSSSRTINATSMAQGYGGGGEGDWKVAALTAIMKAMGEGGNELAFMEDYLPSR